MAKRQGAGSASGNVRFKSRRHALGWVSQQQLADAFEEKARECGLRLAVSVRQVRRWESGDPPWPTPDYQRVLQELFGCPLVELGFTPPWEAVDPGDGYDEDGDDLRASPFSSAYHSGRQPDDPRALGVPPERRAIEGVVVDEPGSAVQEQRQRYRRAAERFDRAPYQHGGWQRSATPYGRDPRDPYADDYAYDDDPYAEPEQPRGYGYRDGRRYGRYGDAPPPGSGRVPTPRPGPTYGRGEDVPGRRAASVDADGYLADDDYGHDLHTGPVNGAAAPAQQRPRRRQDPYSRGEDDFDGYGAGYGAGGYTVGYGDGPRRRVPAAYRPEPLPSGYPSSCEDPLTGSPSGMPAIGPGDPGRSPAERAGALDAGLTAGYGPEPVRQARPLDDDAATPYDARKIGHLPTVYRTLPDSEDGLASRLGLVLDQPYRPLTGLSGAHRLPDPMATPLPPSPVSSPRFLVDDPGAPADIVASSRVLLEGHSLNDLLTRPPGAPNALPALPLDVWVPRAGGDVHAPGLVLPGMEDTQVPDPGRSGRLASPMADQYARLTASYRQMYWVAPAQMTYGPVCAHVAMGYDMLMAPGPSRAHRTVAAALSETAMLAGRIAFFDLGKVDESGRYFETARWAADIAREPLLDIAVTATQAFIPLFAGDYLTAGRMIKAAGAAAVHEGAPSLMRAWLAAAGSEHQSRGGSWRQALDLLNTSQMLLDHPDDRPVPAWLDFFDSTRLWGFRGAAELTAERYDEARVALEDALGELPPTAAKQRAVTYADLALVSVKARDLDEACGLLSRALETLSVQWYKTAMTRVQDVRRELEPFKNAACVKRLDEDLAPWNEAARLAGGALEDEDDRRRPARRQLPRVH